MLTPKLPLKLGCRLPKFTGLTPLLLGLATLQQFAWTPMEPLGQFAGYHVPAVLL